MNNFGEKTAFIWSVADLLRGPYRPNQYKDVMLPMTVLRRLDCVLEPTKDQVLEKLDELEDSMVRNYDPLLFRITGVRFYNTSRYTFESLKGDPNNIAANLTNYIKGFSSRVREVIEHFGFEEHIAKLDRADRLYLLVQRFSEIDLHPDRVKNIEMGYIFEDLIRRFNEASNEEAGDHFTPREVIRLMVDLLFAPDDDALTTEGIVKTLYDPACGTGGMLSVAEEYVRDLNRDAQLEVFGQDYNAQAYAICGSDMMMKGHEIENIAFGDSFTEDQFPGKRFDYMLTNPPFGVEWKPQATFIKREHDEQGYGGRFGAGLPRINDGSFLFLQHMISKMRHPDEGGSRLGIVFSGSPLFTGGSGSGESEIRRWIIENDWLEAIVALPDQLFYNTGIPTYVWVLTNRKENHRRGKIQLIDGSEFYEKMRKSLGDKRHEISDDQRKSLASLHGDFQEGDHVRIFSNAEFGYREIRVDQPLRVDYAVTDERLERVQEENLFKKEAVSRKRDPEAKAREEKEGRKRQAAILDALTSVPEGPDTDDDGGSVYRDPQEFERRLNQALRAAGLSLRASLKNAVLRGLQERDENAKAVRNSKGDPEPDKELRDTERVPLSEDVYDYFEREVKPHLPEAWIDESYVDDQDGEVGRVGYEISFNRYFYQYEPPRDLEQIQEDIRELESEILELLKEVAL